MTGGVSVTLGPSASAENFLAHHDDPCVAPLFREGTVIDGWRITAFLGRGGSGEVYRVEGQVRTGALKVLVRGTETARARFLRETRLLAQMANPAIPRFYGKGEVDGRPYMVMELLEPRALPATDAEVADFLLHLCDGVAILHRMGYVHRDIKPGNIMFRSETPSLAFPVLIDLGLVKDVARNPDAEGTSLSVIDGHMAGVGTPGYAAPEQLVGDTVSPAADIHALGVLANTCFKGHPPPVWGRIIDRATGSIPARRYPDVTTFARAIRHRYWRRNTVIIGALLFAMACTAVAWIAWRAVFDAPRSRIDTHAEDEAYLREKQYFGRIANEERKARELRRQKGAQAPSRSREAFDPSAPVPYEMFMKTNPTARTLAQEQERIAEVAKRISDMMEHQKSITNIDGWTTYSRKILHEMTNLHPHADNATAKRAAQ